MRVLDRYFFYLDRGTVSVAARTMNQAIGISTAAFGLRAGLFFIGYFVFEVLSKRSSTFNGTTTGSVR